jgi:hypothetical protein
MTWNHRVIRHCMAIAPAGEDISYAIEEIWFGIHECYYENPGDEIPTSWTENAVGVIGNDIEELGKTIMKMGVAISKPVLEIDGDKLKVWEG